MDESDIELLRQEMLQIKIALAEEQQGGFLGEPLGGGAAIPGDDALPECFDIKSVENGTLTLEHCFYAVGGELKNYDVEMTCTAVENGFVALRVNATGTTASAELKTYADTTALYNAQQDVKYFVRPLYKFKDGAVAVDMRSMPSLDMVEF